MSKDDDDVIDQDAYSDHDPEHLANESMSTRQIMGTAPSSGSGFRNLFSSSPSGLNVASGLLGAFLPGQYGEAVRNLPQTMEGRQPSTLESIEHHLGGFIPGMEAGGEAIPAMGKGISKGMEYIQPEKTAQELLEKLGQGAETGEQNIANLSHKVGLVHDINEAEAVLPKNELLREYGDQNILQSEGMEQPNLKKIAKIFSPVEANHTPENMDALSSAIRKYYKNGGDIDKLSSKGEDIFGHEGLGEKELKRLDEALPLTELKEGNYRGIKNADEHYRNNDSLLEAHNDYMKNASTNNADTLLSQLGKAERRLKAKPNLHPDEEVALSALQKNKAALKGDMRDYVSTLPEEYQNKYSQFTNMYREHIEPFAEKGNTMLQEMAGGKRQGFTRGDVEGVFANPTQAVSRLAEHIGPEGRGNVLFNKLIEAKGDPERLGQAILDMKSNKGYSQYVTPEMEAIANNLIKRAKVSKIVKGVGGATLGAGLGGIASNLTGMTSYPGAILGGAIGGAKLYGPALIKLLQTMK